MTVCSIDTTMFLIGLLISAVVTILAYKFVLNRLSPKQKWVSITVSIILFVILIFITFNIAQFCTGPFIGPGGEILG